MALAGWLLCRMALFYGETKCVARKKGTDTPCTNGAYYRGQLCGVHCPAAARVALPKNPNKIQHQAELQHLHQISVVAATTSNNTALRRGTIVMTKQRMRQIPVVLSGYQAVFPNYADGGRSDGWGMPALSPKSMGPIVHTQPGLIPALNLENLHQGNKCFAEEMTATHQPAPVFFERRLAMYQDAHPWRHKFKKYPSIAAPGNPNIPVCSIWRLPDGTEQQLTYFESRQIYCHYFTKMIENDPTCQLAFARLVTAVAAGTNLQIFGYDAYEPTTPLEECYKDCSRPFGHELVLLCLLKGEKPWTKYTFLSL